jgi:siroheme synthase-like protein
VWVNVVDTAAQCDFIYGSVLRRGQLQIAVSTGGRAPALAREVRRRLEDVVAPEYGTLVDEIGRAREAARATATTAAGRLAAGERVVARALAAADRAHSVPRGVRAPLNPPDRRARP